MKYAVQSLSGYRLVQLANGVFSVHSTAFRETFHPVVGPVAEAEALYVRQLALPERVRRQDGEFVIWDVGLGAAANPLTVLRALRELPGKLRIVSFDATLEPLRFALEHADALGYMGDYQAALGTLLAERQVQFKDGQQSITWSVQLGGFPGIAGGRSQCDAPPAACDFV